MIDLVAPIKEVTVYADRALITRGGTVSLAAGEHELRINNLPQFIRDSVSLPPAGLSPIPPSPVSSNFKSSSATSSGNGNLPSLSELEIAVRLALLWKIEEPKMTYHD